MHAPTPRVVHHGSITRQIHELELSLSDLRTPGAMDRVTRLLDVIAQHLAGRPSRPPELESITRSPDTLPDLMRTYQTELLHSFEHALRRPR